MEKIKLNTIKPTTNIKQSLKASYAKASEDPNFKNFVKSIDLPEDKKIKYTSSLEEAFKEKQNCEKCKNLFECKNKIQGFIYTPIVEDDELTFSYIACDKKKKFDQKNSYKKLITEYNTGKNYEDPQMKDIFLDDKKRIPIIKALKEFIDNYQENKNIKGIYLHGSFGSGKSYMITALFNELAKKGNKSTIIYWPEFLRSLKAGFSLGDYDDKFETVKRSPILLIDDIGAEQITPWGRDEVLGSILQYRMLEHLPTFFTSNLNLNDLETHLSESKNNTDQVKARRIIERIKQLSDSMELISPSKRS